MVQPFIPTRLLPRMFSSIAYRQCGQLGYLLGFLDVFVHCHESFDHNPGSIFRSGQFEKNLSLGSFHNQPRQPVVLFGDRFP